jgi:hypothetical protein
MPSRVTTPCSMVTMIRDTSSSALRARASLIADLSSAADAGVRMVISDIPLVMVLDLTGQRDPAVGDGGLHQVRGQPDGATKRLAGFAGDLGVAERSGPRDREVRGDGVYSGNAQRG